MASDNSVSCANANTNEMKELIVTVDNQGSTLLILVRDELRQSSLYLSSRALKIVCDIVIVSDSARVVVWLDRINKLNLIR